MVDVIATETGLSELRQRYQAVLAGGDVRDDGVRTHGAARIPSTCDSYER